MKARSLRGDNLNPRRKAVMPITAIRREFSGADVKDVVASVTASAYGVVGVQDGLANLTCVVV